MTAACALCNLLFAYCSGVFQPYHYPRHLLNVVKCTTFWYRVECCTISTTNHYVHVQSSGLKHPTFTLHKLHPDQIGLDQDFRNGLDHWLQLLYIGYSRIRAVDMMRSPRVRKPSQKAREIAEAMVLTRSNSSSTDAKASKPGSKLKPLPRVKKRIRSDSSRAKIKIGKKQGRAMVNSDGVVDVQEVENTQGSEVEEDEDENALYCICLGHDDHTPMIQCEGCENWFHFSCIQLDATEAQKIEAFYCEVCEASGTGPTRTVDELEERQEGTPSADPVSATDLYSPTKEFPLELNHPSNEIDEKVNIDLPRSEPWCDLSLDSPSIKSTTDSLPQSMTCDERKGEQLVLKTESTNSSALVPSPPKTSRRKQKKAEGLSSENENTDG
ncbi:hypothetical protein BY996DRAFT_8409015 [Phakopsora pachyrhizi]|nr:hypothetical protein BY996DRAFT_8409015 [Phakopsora pachyrhizi]